MEIALYCPEYGYYEREHTEKEERETRRLQFRVPRSPCRIGKEGDFYTNVSTGSLFGELLAFQCAGWLEGGAAGRPVVHLVEAGAHDGSLALDILNWLKAHRPSLLNKLEYWLVEPSRRRRTWQQAKLEHFAGQVCWAENFEQLPSVGVHGVIFSNELLDAFPVHRLSWDRGLGKWVEWGIGLSTSRAFVWAPLPSGGRNWDAELKRAGFELTRELKVALPDGYIIESCPSAETWWRQAAVSLSQGRLLTIDYGLTSRELLSPERTAGTLRAYHGHRLCEDALANPGDQDLTAHVNFTQLQRAGENAGLRTEGLFTQAQFLTRIAGAMWSGEGSTLSPRQARQFHSLTHPEHLGRSFRVLVQSRNC